MANHENRLLASKVASKALMALGVVSLALLLLCLAAFLGPSDPDNPPPGSPRGFLVGSTACLGLPATAAFVGVWAIARWRARFTAELAHRQAEDEKERERVFRLFDKWKKWMKQNPLLAEAVWASFEPRGPVREGGLRDAISRLEQVRLSAAPVVENEGRSKHYAHQPPGLLEEISTLEGNVERIALRFLWEGKSDDSRYVWEDRLSNARSGLEHLSNNCFRVEALHHRVDRWLGLIREAEENETPTHEVYSQGRLEQLQARRAQKLGVSLDELQRQDDRAEAERVARTAKKQGLSEKEVRVRDHKLAKAAIDFFYENASWVWRL